MAGIEGKAALRKSQIAREAVSTQQPALSQGRKPNRKPTKSKPKIQARRKRRGSRFLRFKEAEGKTVEFIEMGTAADFPCVEIAFADKTALLFEIGARVTMEPAYSDWRTGNQRLLRRWPAVDCW